MHSSTVAAFARTRVGRPQSRSRVLANAAMIVALTVACLQSVSVRAQDLNDQIEKMTKDAAKKVGPSVVQIITQGGIDMVVTTPKGPVFRKAQGPTTGLIVSEDGYVVSSAF